MKKLKTEGIIKAEPEIESYEELRRILIYDKESEINAKLETINELYKKSESDNENLRFKNFTFLNENKALKEENEMLLAKLEKIKQSKNNKKIPTSNEKQLKHITEFLERSLLNGYVSHYEIKREIDKYIKNTSDRDVLDFLLQRMIIYKRGMVILTEAQIREGFKSGIRTWTDGVGLSKNTISLSLKRLESQGFIIRYNKNIHKSVFFINVQKSREIYNKLKSGEYNFDCIIYLIDVEMIANKKPFSALNINCADPELLKYKARILKAQALNSQCSEPEQLPAVEDAGNTDLEAVENAPINDLVNNYINDKQTTKEGKCSNDNLVENVTLEKISSVIIPEEKLERLEALLSIWNINEKMVTSLTQKENPDYIAKKDAIKKKMQWSIQESDKPRQHDNSLISYKANFTERIEKTIKYLDLQIEVADIYNQLDTLLNSVDEFLA